MRRRCLTLAAAFGLGAFSFALPTAGAERTPEKRPMSVHDFKVKTIDGKEYDLKKLAGKVLMVVNVASQ